MNDICRLAEVKIKSFTPLIPIRVRLDDSYLSITCILVIRDLGEKIDKELAVI